VQNCNSVPVWRKLRTDRLSVCAKKRPERSAQNGKCHIDIPVDMGNRSSSANTCFCAHWRGQSSSSTKETCNNQTIAIRCLLFHLISTCPRLQFANLLRCGSLECQATFDPLELSSVDSTNSDLVEARFARSQPEPEPVDSESEASRNDVAILDDEPIKKRKAFVRGGVPTMDLVDCTRPGSPSSSSDAPSSPDSTHQFFSFDKH
jgi:hypothetical protein